MRVAPDPLQRSGQAALLHPARAFGADGEAHVRVGMADACGREPPGDIALHPLLGQVGPCPRHARRPVPARARPRGPRARRSPAASRLEGTGREDPLDAGRGRAQRSTPPRSRRSTREGERARRTPRSGVPARGVPPRPRGAGVPELRGRSAPARWRALAS